MRNFFRFSLIAICMAIAASVATAADISEALQTQVKQTLAMKYPRIRVEEVSSSPIPGVYEVTGVWDGSPQPNIFYYDLEHKITIVGNLIDDTGRPISQAKLDAIMEKKISGLDLSQAIKVGAGPVQVVMFTDPDCPYCRKLEEFYANPAVAKEITRYVFLTPIPQLHPDAQAKSRKILCSENQVEEMTKTVSGAYDRPKPLPQIDPNLCKEKLAAHQAASVQAGLQGTPLSYVAGKRIDGFDQVNTPQRIIQIINEEKGKTNARNAKAAR